MLNPKPTPPPLTRAQALAQRPVRLVDAQMSIDPDGKGRLSVPLQPPKNAKWLASDFKGRMKTFEFDAVGIFVWQQLDGSTSVEDLIRKLAAEYKLELRQAEASTTGFLRALMDRGLVGMPADGQSSADTAPAKATDQDSRP